MSLRKSPERKLHSKLVSGPAMALFCMVVLVCAAGVDPGCHESDCSDGIDNDGDGLVDCADKGDCCGVDPCDDCSEYCDDLMDNDGDGLIDCDDPDCAGYLYCREFGPNCSDGFDNDGDMLIDDDDPECFISAFLFGSYTDDIPLGDTATQITTTVRGQPFTESRMVDADGCVNGGCGRHCGLNPGEMVTIECGRHSLVQHPQSMSPGSGSYSNTMGNSGPVIAGPADDFALPTGVQIRTDDYKDISVYYSPATLSYVLDTYTVNMVHFHDAMNINGKEFKSEPIAVIHSADGVQHIRTFTENYDFRQTRDPQIYTIVTTTQDGDAELHIKDRTDPIATNGTAIYQLTAMNRSRTSTLTNVLISGTLGGDMIFDASQSSADVVHDGSPSGGTFTIMAGDLASTTARRFRIAAQVPQVGTSTLSADIIADQADPDTSNNSDTETTLVGEYADLRMMLTSNHSPLITDQSFVLTVHIINDGPCDAANIPFVVTVPADLQVDSTDLGTHDGSPNGGLVTGTVLLTLEEDVTGQIVLTPITPGNSIVIIDGSVGVPTGLTDLDLANNSASLSLNQADSTDGTPVPLITTVQIEQGVGQQLSTTQAPGVSDGRITTVFKPYVASDENTIAFKSVLDGDASTSDIIILGTRSNLQTVVREGVSTIDIPGETVGAMDSKIGVNVNGEFAFATRTVPGNLEAGVRGDGDTLPGGGGSLSVIALQNDALPGQGVSFSNIISQMVISDDGTIYLSVDTTGPNNTDHYILKSTDFGQSFSVLAQEGVTIPTNQTGGGMAAWDNFSNETDVIRTGLYVTGSGQHTLLRGDLEGSATSDDVLTINGQVVFQEGQEVAPGLVSDGGFGGTYLAHNGDWYARGAAQGLSFVLRNGQTVSLEGEPLFPGSAENWDQHLFVLGDSSGQYVIGGRNTMSESIVVAYPTDGAPRVILREGEPVDLNGNGAFDDDSFIHPVIADAAVLLSGGRIILRSNVRTGSGQHLGTGLFFKDFSQVEPTGACCFADGSCLDPVTQFDCILGNAWHNGLACEAITCTPDSAPGDLNGDGDIDGTDVQPFVDCILNSGPNCDTADVNSDGATDIDDIQDFVLLLL